MNLAEVERFQRNQTIGHRIVQLAVDTRAFCVIVVVMMAMLRDTFLLQRTNLRNRKLILRSESDDRPPDRATCGRYPRLLRDCRRNDGHASRHFSASKDEPPKSKTDFEIGIRRSATGSCNLRSIPAPSA